MVKWDGGSRIYVLSVRETDGVSIVASEYALVKKNTVAQLSTKRLWK